MTMHFDPAAIDTAANTQPASAPNVAIRSNARRFVTPVAKETSRESPAVAPTIGTQEANITFRRDPNGRVYYVVTDAQS
jgi:hypothetical protein